MRLLYLLLFLFITNTSFAQSLSESVKSLPFLTGKKEYLNSPFATTGDRLYLVGHQNGQFPDIGWHISGEMGGIWAHPIKLLDGFAVSIDGEDLRNARQFTNFPIANQHRYLTKNFQILRTQFVPDGIISAVSLIDDLKKPLTQDPTSMRLETNLCIYQPSFQTYFLWVVRELLLVWQPKFHPTI